MRLTWRFSRCARRETQWSGGWTVSNDAYKLEATTHAGGLGPDPTALGAICPLNSGGSRYVCPNNAVMKQALQQFDVVLDESYHSPGYAHYTLDEFKTRWNITDADVASGAYPFLANNAIFRTDKRLSADGAGSAWFESALPHADIVLSDIASKLVPSAVASGYTTRFLRNIAAGETVTQITGASCSDPFAVCPGETAPPSPSPRYNYCVGTLCLIAAPPSPPPPPIPPILPPPPSPPPPVPPSPSPPPPTTPPPTTPPPPPPSPAPPGASKVPVVRVTAALETTLEAFDAAAQASYISQLATTAGVTPSDVTLAITGGSITVTATIRTENETAAQSASTAIAAAISATASSNTFLGFTTAITPVAPTVALLTLAAPPPTPPPVDDNSLPGWGAALIGIFSAFFFFSFVFIFLLIGRERNGKPMFGTLIETKIEEPVSTTAQNMEKSSV